MKQVSGQALVTLIVLLLGVAMLWTHALTPVNRLVHVTEWYTMAEEARQLANRELRLASARADNGDCQDGDFVLGSFEVTVKCRIQARQDQANLPGIPRLVVTVEAPLPGLDITVYRSAWR